MIADTSAAFALMAGEPDAEAISRALVGVERPAIAAPTMVELYIVVGNRGGEAATNDVDEFVRRFGIDVVPFTAEHAAFAREGWRRFGKGRHPAALNFGDCFAYALAKARGEPLLLKGDDFARTDVTSAIT